MEESLTFLSLYCNQRHPLSLSFVFRVYVEWQGYNGAYLHDHSDRRYTHFTGELISKT